LYASYNIITIQKKKWKNLVIVAKSLFLYPLVLKWRDIKSLPNKVYVIVYFYKLCNEPTKIVYLFILKYSYIWKEKEENQNWLFKNT